MQILHGTALSFLAKRPLKDFVHHNTLHAFSNTLPFHQALKQANTSYGFKGYLSIDEYKSLYKEGKIKSEILQQVLKITSVKKEAVALGCKNPRFLPQYKQNLSKVGSFRAHWKVDYHTNLGIKGIPSIFI